MAVDNAILLLLIYTPLSSQFSLVEQSEEKVSSLKTPVLDFSLKEAVTVRNGSKLTLLCSVDDFYEWCTFTNPRGDTCNFEWKRSLWNVTSLGCQLGGGARFVGNYGEKQCGLELSISTSDSGSWSCEIEQYRFGGSRGSGWVARGGLDLQVTIPTTTTTTTPQPTTTTTNTTTILNLDRRGKSLDISDEAVVSRSGSSLVTVVVSGVLAFGAISIALSAMVCHRRRERRTAREVVVATVKGDLEKIANENAIDAVYEGKVRDSVNLEEELEHMKKYFPHVITFPAKNTSSEEQIPQWPKSL